MKKETSVPWWDGRYSDTFFPLVYRIGDDSLEGHADNRNLDLQSRTVRECDMVERVLSLVQGSRILDCPCGYGRHAIEFASRGFDVVGVDLCPTFLNEARSTAAQRDLRGTCNFLEADMRSLPDELGEFDVCLNMFLAFGFFSDEENQRVLGQFHQALLPGGRLLIHSDVNPDRAYGGRYSDRGLRHLRDGSVLKIDEQFDARAGILHGSWTVSSRSASRKSCYSIRVYTHDELNAMLHDAGFTACEILFPFDTQAIADNPPQEVVYVAYKR